MNRYPLLSKTLMIGLLALLLLIPLSMIQSKISERKMLQGQVQEDIARSASGPQTISGPYLVITYKLREYKTNKDDKGNESTRDRWRWLYWFGAGSPIARQWP